MIHLSLDSLKEQNEQTHRYSSEWLEGFKSHGIHGMISTFPQFSGIEAEGAGVVSPFGCCCSGGKKFPDARKGADV